MDMGNQDRTSVNIGDLRERIDNAREGIMWQELSLNQKIRILLQERLEEIEQEKSSSSSQDQ